MPRAAARTAALLALLVLVALAGSARAATNISGTLTGVHNWTLAGSPYVLTVNTTIAAGASVTIDEGVVVQGNHQLRTLTVNGTLTANGSSSQPVTFTSTTDTAAGQWLGIVFNAGSTGTLKYVNARYGGGGAGADTAGMVKVNGGAVTIEDSTFTQSSVSGVAINGGTSGTAASLTVRRTKFESNGFYASSNGDGRPYSARDAAFDATVGAIGDGFGYLGARCAASLLGRSLGGAAKADVGLSSRGLRPAAGTRVRPSGVPEGWRIRGTKTAGGTRYSDPSNPGNSVRVMQGSPSSTYPSSQAPYVAWQRNGQPLDVNGNVLPSANVPEAHIPLSDFKFLPEVFK